MVLLEPYQVVLEKLLIAVALAVTQQSILEFLHLSHPERNINNTKNILTVKCKEVFLQQKHNVFFMAQQSNYQMKEIITIKVPISRSEFICWRREIEQQN